MDLSEPDQNVFENILSVNHYFKSIEIQLENLAKEIETKNQQILKIDQNDLNSFEGNEKIESFLKAKHQNDTNFRNELVEFRKFVTKPGQDPNSEVVIKKIDNLISRFEAKISLESQFERNYLLKIIELESKVVKLQNNLAHLQDKNEILEKIIHDKNVYIDALLKFIEEIKKKQNTLENSFKKELQFQNNLSESLNSEVSKLKEQNQKYEKKIEECSKESELLSKKLTESDLNYRILQEKCAENNEKYEIEKENLTLEIKKLENLFEKSKSDLLEKYLEKFYPNITIINQMFDKKMSICQLYSQFLETQNVNKNLSIEKSVLEERLQTLTNDLDEMKTSMDKYLQEIERLKQLEVKVLKLENENKELKISLKFYQDSADSLYKGGKVFHEKLMNLSDKIKSLVEHETNQINQDSTGMMALKYIMELQNKFDEFNKIQTEFEKKKLDFINEKQNLIESENKIDLLNDRLAMCDAEKRQLTIGYELLNNEYQMLKELAKNSELELKMQTNQLQQTIDRLNKELETAQIMNTKLETQLKECKNQLEKLQRENDEQQKKINNDSKQTKFLNERLTMQTELVCQLEKSLANFRKQNENLMKSKEHLEVNFRLMEERNRELSNSIAEIDSKLSAHKFEIDLCKQKERFLLERLENAHKVFNKSSELDFILDSLSKNKCSIDENLVKTLELVQEEKKSFNKMFEEKEKQWKEEKSILEARVVQLVQDLKNEIDRNSQIETKLLEVSSALEKNVLSDNSGETTSTEFVAQFSQRNSELVKELNQIKQQILASGQENMSLVQCKNQLEQQLVLSEEAKSKLSSELDKLRSDSRDKLSQVEDKLRKEMEQLQNNYQQQNVQLENKNLTCDLYLKRIETLNQTIEEYKQKQEEQKINMEKLYIIEQSYQMVKHELENLKKQSADEKQISQQLRIQMNEYQKRFIDSETSKIQLNQELMGKLESIQAEYEELSNEHDALIRSDEKFHFVHRKLSQDLECLSEKIQSNQMIANEDWSKQLFAVKEALDCLTNRNRLLLGKNQTLIRKEERLNEEIRSLNATIENLEKCVQNEKNNCAHLKQLYQLEQKPDLSEELSQSLQKLRAENNELQRKCELFQSTIKRLEEDLENRIKKDSDQKLSDQELNNLRASLRFKEDAIKQMDEKSKRLETKIAKIQQEYSDILEKFQQQSTEMASLNEKLTSNSGLLQKYTSELEEHKSANLKRDNDNINLNKKIESLQQEIVSMQNTNKQLKILARKYKSQCDEYQQQQQQQQQNQNPRDSNETSSDNKIKELVATVENLSAERQELNSRMEKMNEENQKLQKQTEESENRAKAITQQVKQKFANLKRMIIERDNEIGYLKSMIPQSGSSFMIPGKSGKMQVSSTMVSASSAQQQPSTSSFHPSSLFQSASSQPSSSNEDNEDRLQSAQISSHTTSIDDNNLESFVRNQATTSNNNNNKRRLSEQQPGNSTVNPIEIKRKRENENEINQNVIKQQDEEHSMDSHSETGQTESDENNVEETINEESNEERDVGVDNNHDDTVDQSNQEQTESNDGNASSTDSSSNLDRNSNLPSNSSNSTILENVLFQPSTSNSVIVDPNRMASTQSIVVESDSNRHSSPPSRMPGGFQQEGLRSSTIVSRNEIVSPPNLEQDSRPPIIDIDDDDDEGDANSMLSPQVDQSTFADAEVPRSGEVSNPQPEDPTPSSSDNASRINTSTTTTTNPETSNTTTSSSSTTPGGNSTRSRKLKIRGTSSRGRS